MDRRQKEDLRRLCAKRVQFECSMSKFTTFQVGGKAEALYEACNLENLQAVIAYLNRENIGYLVLGRGSNLLVKDEGLEGVVIHLGGSLANIREESRNGLDILAGAGLPLIDLLAYCRASGLGGLEFLAGIPGTVGGAVAMNAGAFGKEAGDRVMEVHIVTANGDMDVRDRSGLKFSYRGLQLEKGSVIIASRLRIDLETQEIVAKRIAGYLKKRKESQPLEYPSAGSVFKNPPNDFAGRLVEQVGLKGKKIGGAMISKKHANYIVNTGGATAKDIIGLMNLVRQKVKKETGIELEPEIQVAGK
jgi:UDP-N-acetylmuramate dehydrogenase